MQGICSIEKTLIKIVPGLSETGKFPKMLSSLFDTFGIHAKGQSTKKTTLEQAKQNVTEIHEYMQTTVVKVKERSPTRSRQPMALKVPFPTRQQSLELLNKGLRRLIDNVKCLNPQYFENVNLATLLTTQVENLHAVSHFKHKIFSVLQYAQDFGTIAKESLKGTTFWPGKYFTHDRSYYTVPESTMPLSAVSFIAPLPAKQVTPETERQMKEWLENYRPVRQRTVRSETMKDKAGTLPPAVYQVAPQASLDLDGEADDASDDHYPNERDTGDEAQVHNGANTATNVTAHGVADITFVNDSEIGGVQMDEFESDSDDEEDVYLGSDDDSVVSQEVFHPVSVTRSGRRVRAFVRFV